MNTELEHRIPEHTVVYSYLPSPIGELLVTRDRIGLTGLLYPGGRHSTSMLNTTVAVRDDAAFADVDRQLREYFAGDRTEFDLALNPAGTDFQRRVWQALMQIPYGKTASYGQQALLIGAPRAVRAVGLANGRNPISIIVPCHRVIGADGSLTGYGGGLETKRWLLDHESTPRLL